MKKRFETFQEEEEALGRCGKCCKIAKIDLVGFGRHLSISPQDNLQKTLDHIFKDGEIFFLQISAIASLKLRALFLKICLFTPKTVVRRRGYFFVFPKPINFQTVNSRRGLRFRVRWGFVHPKSSVFS